MSFLKFIKNKELFIALYFLLFILGWTLGFSQSYYNEFRVLQIVLLLSFGIVSLLHNLLVITKQERFFFIYLAIGIFVWEQSSFIVIEMLLVYLLYKNFRILKYKHLVTKIILLSSFSLFLLLPLSLWDYVSNGIYDANWYPVSWNIRVYDSYFLILSIFATWFYISEQKYKNIYLLFLFLAFFAVLLDAGRSVMLAYTSFMIIVAITHKSTRLPLILTYISSWLAYLAITYAANIGSQGLGIVRESSSGRIDLWVNGLKCWMEQPIFGCGFYQLEHYPHLSAHPHNLFIQVLAETGIIGLGFLAFMIFNIIRHISWNIKQNYFVMAALLAVSIDMSLSGVHIYPITQIALLWLFVFLLKNPEFKHAQYFNQPSALASRPQQLLAILIYTLIGLWFIYMSMQAFNFPKDLPMTPPRFWGYGYRLY